MQFGLVQLVQITVSLLAANPWQNTACSKANDDYYSENGGGSPSESLPSATIGADAEMRTEAMAQFLARATANKALFFLDAHMYLSIRHYFA